MFFDDNRQDEVYPRLLQSIARTQRALLDCRFQWEKRTRIAQRTGLFGKKKPDPKYDALLAQLEDLKRRTQQHRAKMGYGSGTFWWNLPWAQLEDYLIYDLTQEEEAGAWRFQRTWRTAPSGHGTLLLLHEEGHYSSFSSTSDYEFSIISAYSEKEINEKMRDFENMQNRYDFEFLVAHDEHHLHSVQTGRDYYSASEYLNSAEHADNREREREEYERSLYTEKETTTLSIESNSTHYEALFAVAEFTLSAGSVRDLTILNYELCDSRGDLPGSIRELYASKDAAVGCAAYLEDHGQVRGVPLELFGGDLKGSVASFQDAVRQAEIYTCLADKIIL